MSDVADEITFSQRNVDSFWEKVNIRSPGECWEWQASLRDGYGSYWCRDNRKTTQAHRFSMEIFLGRRITRGAYVLHSCDNPPCVNPRHLSEGTPLENMRQMAERNRKVVVKGEEQPRAKLTWELVREIRSRSKAGESASSIARSMPVGETVTRKIIRGERWKEV